MTIEDATRQLEAVVMLFPYWTPFLVIACFICGPRRDSRWIAPFWVFASCPVLLLLGMLFRAWAILVTTHGSGPDWGWVGMGMIGIGIFSLWEVIPGGLLLYLYPRGAARGRHALFPSMAAALLALAGSYYVLSHLPTSQQ